MWSLPLEHIDSTKAEVHWEAEADGHPAARGLASAAAAGTAVVLQFELRAGAELFAFWGSAWSSGGIGGWFGNGSRHMPDGHDAPHN